MKIQPGSETNCYPMILIMSQPLKWTKQFKLLLSNNGFSLAEKTVN